MGWKNIFPLGKNMSVVENYLKYISGEAFVHDSSRDMTRGPCPSPCHNSTPLGLPSIPTFLMSRIYGMCVMLCPGHVKMLADTTSDQVLISGIHRQMGIRHIMTGNPAQGLEYLSKVTEPRVRDTFGFHICSAIALLSISKPDVYAARIHLGQALTFKPSPDACPSLLVGFIEHALKTPYVSSVLIPFLDVIWEYPHHTDISRKGIRNRLQCPAITAEDGSRYIKLRCVNSLPGPILAGCCGNMIKDTRRQHVISLMAQLDISKFDDELMKIRYQGIKYYLDGDAQSLEEMVEYSEYLDQHIKASTRLWALCALFSLYRYTDGPKAASICDILVSSRSETDPGIVSVMLLWLIGYHYAIDNKIIVNDLIRRMFNNAGVLKQVGITDMLLLSKITHEISDATSLMVDIHAVRQISQMTKKPNAVLHIDYMLKRISKNLVVSTLTSKAKEVSELLSELMRNPSLDIDMLTTMMEGVQNLLTSPVKRDTLSISEMKDLSQAKRQRQS